MLSFLSVNSTFRGSGDSPGSALCLAFALASPGTATMSKVKRRVGHDGRPSVRPLRAHGGELRRHAKVTRIVVDGGAVQGVELSDGTVGRAPVVVSNLDPTATFAHLVDPDSLPDAFARRVATSTTGRRTSRRTSPFRDCPSTGAPTRNSTAPTFGRNVTFFGTAEEMQADFEGCVRGWCPRSPSFNLQIPSLDDPSLAPEGMHAASSFAFYLPVTRDRESQNRVRDEMAERIVDKITAAAPNFPDLIERQLNYPAFTYELMFGCTGRGLHPRFAAARIHGPLPAGFAGLGRQPVPVEGLYLCGAGCHGGPGVTFIPGYNCGYDVWRTPVRRSGCSDTGAP